MPFGKISDNELYHLRIEAYKSFLYICLLVFKVYEPTLNFLSFSIASGTFSIASVTSSIASGTSSIASGTSSIASVTPSGLVVK